MIRNHSFSAALIVRCAVYLLLTQSVFAHNPETSYVRININANQVEFKLIYDVSTLLKIAPLDTNGDGRISRQEFLSSAGQIESYLRHHVFSEINSQEAELGEMLPPVWPSDAGAAISQKDYQQRLLSFVFKNRPRTEIEDVAICFDFFSELGDRHTILGLFVHGQYEQDVIFDRFEPDYLYDTKMVRNGADQVVAVTGQGANEEQRSFSATVWGQMASFLNLGVRHIFLGYDHILFLMGLMILSRFWDLVKIVTSFTVAHTITLILATLQW